MPTDKKSTMPTINDTAHFPELVNGLSEIVFTLDKEWRLSFLNPAWETITHYPVETCLGCPLKKYVFEEDYLHIMTLADTNNIRQEIRIKTALTEPLWVICSLTKYSAGHYGTLINISEQKQLELALRSNEERYAILASSTTDGIWDWNLLTDQVFFSPRWKSMIGYQEHEIGNHISSWYQLVHPDDIQKAMADVKDCLEGDKPAYENIHRLKHKDGSWRWIFDRGVALRDQQGRPYRMVGSHADVTVLKETEEALRQRENELEAIFSISPDGIITVMTDGRIQTVNPAFLLMTEFNRDLLVGLPEAELDQSLKEISDIPRHRRHLYSEDRQVYSINLPKLQGHRLHDRRARLPEDQAAEQQRSRVLERTERYVQGHGIAKVLYFRDISVESEIDQMKSEFLSTAAHELRTPMASVFGYSELLLSREFDFKTMQEIVTTIYQQSASLVEMLNQLLDLARIESRTGIDFCFARQPLWPIVERAVKELMIPGDARKVSIRKPRIQHWVDVDADKLRQVITNVLANAYKYSPDGGAIELSLKVKHVSSGVDEVGIVIRDHGIGMNEAEVEHVFDRFWRAHNSSEIPGTGLGMSLVKEIMDIFQGSIEIQSLPQQGTMVTLWLKKLNALV